MSWEQLFKLSSEEGDSGLRHRVKFGYIELPPATERLKCEAPKELLQDGKFYMRKSRH